jgi:hypothetical protein
MQRGICLKVQIYKREKDTLAIGSYMNIATLYYDQYKDDQFRILKSYQLSKQLMTLS